MRGIVAWARRRPWLASALAVVVAAAAAFGVVAAGVMPITASSGHWPITEWFLHFAMRRSVSTYARLAPQPPPELNGRPLVLRGAGHFDVGCRPCHGAPGDALPPIPQGMTPRPPTLADRVDTWNARELFYLVKHGVKFTGMPAWPAQQRDDEVWAMVAFLQQLPQLSPQQYAALVRGDGDPVADPASTAAATPPGVVTTRCARCHGGDGMGRDQGAFPKLAGQRLEYMTRALRAYAEGRRFSGVMRPIAAGLSPEARDTALRYYAGLPRGSTEGDRQSEQVRRGEEIARRGVPAQDVPSCAKCHGTTRVNEAYPRLAGQDREYLVLQLELLQAGRRGGSEFVHLMDEFVGHLTRRQIEDVAAYFASLE